MTRRGGLMERLHALLLYAYPRSFRVRFGSALERDYAEALRDALVRGRLHVVWTVVSWSADAVVTGARERIARMSGRSMSIQRGTIDARARSGERKFDMGFLGVGRDLRIAMRRLRRQPALVVVVVLTLGLAIGAATTVFMMMDAMLLRSLGYADADRLVALQTVDERGRLGTKLSQPEARDLAMMVGAFESVAEFDWGAVALAGGTGEPEMVRSAHVSWTFFATFRVVPAMGRGFDASEDVAGRGDVVVLSDGLWRRRFGSDPGVLGTTVTIQNRPHTVIGVLPRGFEDPAAAEGGYAELYLPLALEGALAARSVRWLQAVARLAPGATVVGATREIERAAARLAEVHPETNTGVGFSAIALQDAIWGEARRPVTLMLAATIAVLLIACSNLANLMLARSAFRRHEIAVQRAMGAGGGAIARQLILESLLLALLGGAAGVAVTAIVSSFASAVLGDGLPRLANASMNVTVLAFALVASMIAALVFGVFPSLHAIRSAPGIALEGGRGIIPGSQRGFVRRLLVAVQVTLSVVLLTGAVLLLRSVQQLVAVDPGFDTESHLSWELILPSATYSEPWQIVEFHDQLSAELEHIPGVVAAGAINKPPLGTRWGCGAFAVAGEPLPDRPESWPCAESRVISSGYLAAAGTPVVQGRGFMESDDERAPRSALVNEALAALLWPDQNPLGKRIAWAEQLEQPEPWLTIVGVIGDVRHRGPTAPVDPAIYVPFRQAPDRRMTWVARASSAPLALLPSVRTVIGTIDSTLPLRQPQSLRDALAASIGPQRNAAIALGCIAVFALGLALVGVHGVLSYVVAQRRAEIGVRMAFGATSRDVLRSVLGNGLVTVTLATAIGLGLAAALARVLRGFLHGVAPTNAVSYVAVAVIVLATAVLACWLPAHRASRLDPTVALRSD